MILFHGRNGSALLALLMYATSLVALAHARAVLQFACSGGHCMRENCITGAPGCHGERFAGCGDGSSTSAGTNNSEPGVIRYGFDSEFDLNQACLVGPERPNGSATAGMGTCQFKGTKQDVGTRIESDGQAVEICIRPCEFACYSVDSSGVCTEYCSPERYPASAASESSTGSTTSSGSQGGVPSPAIALSAGHADSEGLAMDWLFAMLAFLLVV